MTDVRTAIQWEYILLSLSPYPLIWFIPNVYSFARNVSPVIIEMFKKHLRIEMN